MTPELLILGTALYLLFWEHLPHWGTWFTRAIAALPGPLQTLYEQWRCPYCVGFWIGLALHAATGMWLFPAFGLLPDWWGPLALPLGWVFDALAFAVLNKGAVLALNALGLFAIRGMESKAAWMQKMQG